MENTEEIWKDVVGYEGHYKVSNLGNIMSFKHKKSGKLMKKHYNGRGYLSLDICKDGNVKKWSIHRLVATAFLPNIENKPCVNHIDGNPSNNNLNNLEWCTYSENELHSFRVLGKKAYSHWTGIKGANNPSSKIIYQFSLDGVFIRLFESKQLAAEFLKENGFPKASSGSLGCAVSGLYHSAYGSKWSYSPNFTDEKKYKTSDRKKLQSL